MRSRRLRLWMACWGVAAATVAAMAGAQWLSAVARTPDRLEEKRSLLGSYLAGRFARGQHDTTAAADFYARALTRDPDNEVLVEQAFLMEATEGDWTRAVELARHLVGIQDTHRMGQLVLGLTAFKSGNYAAADAHFRAAGSGPIGELTSMLLRAWVKLATGEVDSALELLEGGKQAEWAQFYIRYHRALIADLGRRPAEARKSFERVFKMDSRTPRTAMAYALHSAKAGDVKLAKAILNEHLDKSAGDGHPTTRALRDQLEAGQASTLLVSTVQEGIAEVFYGLGEALTGEGGISIGALYLQMALFVRPDFPFALAALANVHETTKRHAEAIEIYARIPRGTPLQTSIDIRKAINLNMLDRTEEAKALLDRLHGEDPADLRVLDAIGTILRGRKRYAEAVEYYTRAIGLLEKPEKRHWTYWYARGTSYERLKQWPQAETDLRKAMQLNPDQPLVLNYLGYSWIDQNRNLKQGLSLIEKAVALKPDDGYIVDSLGWAHYRLGNYKDAVRFLERAVELKPEDPVLNDHLGDALWRVSRFREARFQWQQSLSLNPEPEDAEKIKAKLQKGLAEKPVVRGQKKSRQAARAAAGKKGAQTKLVPGAPVQ
ncbi:MAG: tetratricopeptide repeat protein [Hyphomicrobiaceae bacterium]|nr:tetratricopeptide repeat protein [Hyphomicrobiaceae bacterium]